MRMLGGTWQLVLDVLGSNLKRWAHSGEAIERAIDKEKSPAARMLSRTCQEETWIPLGSRIHAAYFLQMSQKYKLGHSGLNSILLQAKIDEG